LADHTLYNFTFASSYHGASYCPRNNLDFNKFDVIYLITQGGPQTVVNLAGQQKVMGATDLLITKIYKTAFQYPNSWGMAAAMGYLVFLVLLLLSLLNLQIQNLVKE